MYCSRLTFYLLSLLSFLKGIAMHIHQKGHSKITTTKMLALIFLPPGKHLFLLSPISLPFTLYRPMSKQYNTIENASEGL